MSVVKKRQITLPEVYLLLNCSYERGVATAIVAYNTNDILSMKLEDENFTFFYRWQTIRLHESHSTWYKYRDWYGNTRYRSIGEIRKYFRAELSHLLGFTTVARCETTKLFYFKEYMHKIDGLYYLDVVMCRTHWGVIPRTKCVPATYVDAFGQHYYYFPKRLLSTAIQCPECYEYVAPEWYSEESHMCKTCQLHKHDGVIESGIIENEMKRKA